MQTVGFYEALEEICAADPRYHREAYAFLRDAFHALLKRYKKSKKPAPSHVGAAELLEGFRQHALEEFGPMTMTVLDYWGVQSCEDIGNMVFHLIHFQVLGSAEQDTPEAFQQGFDFAEAFIEPFRSEEKRMSSSAADVVGNDA